MKVKHVQNTAVQPSWGQLWRENKCAVFGHQFYVPAGGGYPGMPQSHCYRCGKRAPDYMLSEPAKVAEWCEPSGAKNYD